MMPLPTHGDKISLIFRVNDDTICLKIISENITLKTFKNTLKIKNTFVIFHDWLNSVEGYILPVQRYRRCFPVIDGKLSPLKEYRNLVAGV